MQKRIGKLPFKGTPEQEKQLLQVIESHKGQQGALMPVLQGLRRSMDISP